MNCITIGVAGGSCSGKTTLARALVKALGAVECGVLFQDSYYIDQSHRFKEDGGEVNFDHPNSLEFSLLARHLDELKAGHEIAVPVYDFKTHSRLSRTETFSPRRIVLVDGTLILSQPEIRCRLDHAIFVAAPEELRFERRRTRDVRERGRELEGVVRQFMNHVKPMHDQFVEPSRVHATETVSGENIDETTARQLTKKLGL